MLVRIAKAYWGITWSPDYANNGAPDIASIDKDGGGLPLPSGWVPNPTSPGVGSMNPSDQPAPPEGFGKSPNPQWGTGVGSQLGPKESSEKLGAQKLGDYIMGKAVQE